MEDEKVIEKFCELSALVGHYFKSEYAADCFCRKASPPPNWEFRFEEKVMSFIEEAVKEKIERDGQPKSRWENI